MPPADPVKVAFGRPDIGKYLTETLATASVSDATPEGERASGLDASRHRDPLDRSQARSKAVLLKVDSNLDFKQTPAMNKQSQVSLCVSKRTTG